MMSQSAGARRHYAPAPYSLIRRGPRLLCPWCHKRVRTFVYRRHRMKGVSVRRGPRTSFFVEHAGDGWGFGGLCSGTCYNAKRARAEWRRQYCRGEVRLPYGVRVRMLGYEAAQVLVNYRALEEVVQVSRKAVEEEKKWPPDLERRFAQGCNTVREAGGRIAGVERDDFNRPVAVRVRVDTVEGQPPRPERYGFNLRFQADGGYAGIEETERKLCAVAANVRRFWAERGDEGRCANGRCLSPPWTPGSPPAGYVRVWNGRATACSPECAERVGHETGTGVQALVERALAEGDPKPPGPDSTSGGPPR